uniref:Uncharacterized protein n=1 Tax=Haptolina brevifila TaxID=156173 RepID=A0A6U7LS46_9EUKA
METLLRCVRVGALPLASQCGRTCHSTSSACPAGRIVTCAQDTLAPSGHCVHSAARTDAAAMTDGTTRSRDIAAPPARVRRLVKGDLCLAIFEWWWIMNTLRPLQ